MIVAAAVCPNPPVLIPQVAPGTDQELRELREACTAAVATLTGSAPDRIIVLGAGEDAETYDESAGGSLAPYGVDVHAGADSDELPLNLTIGAWLLDQAGWTGPRTYAHAIAPTTERVALLVVADGSARRSLQAPGYFDERAEGFDATIAKALAGADPATLAAIDLDLANDLAVAGAPALKELGRATRGADIVAQLRYDAAPLGVGYIVADWVLS